MKKIFFLLMNFLYLKAYCVSELYEKNEDIKQALGQNVYEPNYFTMFFGLFFVIALVYLTGYLYQKMTKVKLINKNVEQHSINIENTISIGQGRNLHIINVDNKSILIGATQNNITYIKDLDNTIESDGIDDKSC